MKGSPDNCVHLTAEIVREIHAEAIEVAAARLTLNDDAGNIHPCYGPREGFG